jgi:YbbR domain-containing protein
MDRLFDNEWILRALALVLAIVLWVQASLYFITIGPATIGHVPLHIVNVPAGFVATTPVRDVAVTVLAPSTLSHLTPADFVATVAPRGAASGSQSAPVAVVLPRGTRLKAVEPAVVPIRLVRQLVRPLRRASAPALVQK